MGQFDFIGRIGATDRAVAVLNDQPELFTTLIVVVVGLLAQSGLVVAIHFATRKEEQKKKKNKAKDNMSGAGGKGGRPRS